jgi:Uma2 family endonuclease
LALVARDHGSWRSQSMASSITEPPMLDALIERLGVPLSRILAQPAPGTATEADLLEAERRYGRLYELVDGVLVEKAIGYRESILAGALIRILGTFVVAKNLGVVSGADGSIRLFPGLIRIPDVAFASWDCFPNGKIPDEPIPTLAPDLAIEVLSKSNTAAEMKRKRREYFRAGVRLIWEVNPKRRKVSVFTPVGRIAVLELSQQLDGGDLLHGFIPRLSDLFGELDRHR